jgi:PAS domain-containing protein
MMSPAMVDASRSAVPALITIPASDAAFREHVRSLDASSPTDLQARLRRLFPRVVVRERMISGDPAWYIYRDGAWGTSLHGDWWDDERMPRIVVNGEGWFVEANAMARGLLGMDPDDAAPHHFTDFVAPGTLDDSLALFKIVGEGKTLDATILLRPTTGDVIAVDLHCFRDGADIVGVFRLADDVAIDLPTSSPSVSQDVQCIPARDVAFRAYVHRAMDRMPEPTPDGLALRLRRVYAHASVEVVDERWVARRDRGDTDAASQAWWRDADLPCVRYDSEALILEANVAAEAFFGQPIVGHHWQEFVTPGSTEQVTIMLEILADVGAAESRFRMPHADGSMMEFDSYTEVHGEEYVTVFRPVPDSASGRDAPSGQRGEEASAQEQDREEHEHTTHGVETPSGGG